MQEVNQILSFMQLLGDKLVAAESDGSISIIEVIEAIPSLVTSGMAAVTGLPDLSVEVKNMSREDLEALVLGVFDAVKPYVQLMGLVKPA